MIGLESVGWRCKLSRSTFGKVEDADQRYVHNLASKLRLKCDKV